MMLAVLFQSALILGSDSVDHQTPIDFDRQVRPLFAERCLYCHGAESQEGGLRLHRRDSFVAGGDHGPVVIAGDASKSRLIKYVRGEMPKRMPPVDDGPGLTAAEIELLERWINQGARWGKDIVEEEKITHWAYLPISNPNLPVVATLPENWQLHPIDHFVGKKLVEAGFVPSPREIDRGKLLRRLSLDLTGMPPTIKEMDQFIHDSRPNAYEQAVAKLLDSPHFGERWAVWWLDLARYADTHGYEKDPARVAYRYRDWVINAFNRDLPFSQFTIEQLAGDLLPNPTLDQRIATGFHRNTMTNTEGGVDPEEARYAVVYDRVDTTATIWLGTTLACARCHSHKFDPITQREYYEFLAYFNSQDETQIDAPTAEQMRQAEILRSEMAALEEKLDQEAKAYEEPALQWADSLLSQHKEAEQQWRSQAPLHVATAGKVQVHAEANHALVFLGPNQPHDTYQVTYALENKTEIKAVRLEVLPDVRLPNGGPGRLPNGTFVLNGVKIEVTDGVGPWQIIDVDRIKADYIQPGHEINSLIQPHSIAQPTGQGWAISRSGANQQQRQQLILHFRNRLIASSAMKMRVTLTHRSPWPEGNIGKFRLSWSADERIFDADCNGPLANLPAEIQAQVLLPPAQRSEVNRNLLAKYYSQQFVASVKTAAGRLRTLRQRVIKPSTAMVVSETRRPRQSYVHEGGNFLSKGLQVTPGVPAMLHKALLASPPIISANFSSTTQRGTTNQEPLDRLSLARWLVDSRQPLTARVQVNRIWEQLFGRGLVVTSEDFGSQSTKPSHPDLLDYLAYRFVASGWSIKNLLREIVLSETYRQSSRSNEIALAKDPTNTWLARGARFRVEAEFLRDIGLVASGMLQSDVGGPSVFPPQPPGIWAMIYNGEQWTTAIDKNRYRRGLYTYIRRTAPYPAFTTFDATSREICIVKRTRSNTPLQALTLLNDEAFFEFAQGLGREVYFGGQGSVREKLSELFRRCTARQPQDAELSVLEKLWTGAQHKYAQFPKLAKKVLLQNYFGPSTPVAENRQADLAAFIVVANACLNLDETVTKE